MVDVRSKGVTEKDSAKNDFVQGGVGFKFETYWDGDNIINIL